MWVTNLTKSQSKTVLCAIQFSNMEPWKSIRNYGQIPTFLAQEIHSGIDFMYFEGLDAPRVLRLIEKGHETLRYRRLGIALVPIDRVFTYPIKAWIPNSLIHQNLRRISTLRIEVLDLFPLLLWKYFGLYNYFLNATNFDFLFTTNSNCYVLPKNLQKLIQDLPMDNLYAGTPLKAGIHSFASGANRLMSRDIVYKLVKNISNMDRGLIEDVAQGKFLEQENIKLYPLKTKDLHSLTEASLISSEALGELHQIRIKSTHARKEKDVEIMHFLHAMVMKLQQ